MSGVSDRGKWAKLMVMSRKLIATATQKPVDFFGAWLQRKNHASFADGGPLEFAHKIAVRQKSKRLIHVELSPASEIVKVIVFARYGEGSLFFRFPAPGLKNRISHPSDSRQIWDSSSVAEAFRGSILLVEASRNAPLENNNLLADLSRHIGAIHGVVFALGPPGLGLIDTNDEYLAGSLTTNLLSDSAPDRALDRLGLKAALKGLCDNPASPGIRNIQICYVPGGSIGQAIKSRKVPSTVAVIPCYNEEDIIGETIEYALDQGMSVHIIDNWSNDGTSRIVKDYASKFSDVTFEVFPDKPSTQYQWVEILQRIAEYGATSGKDWIFRLDADERFECPIAHLTIPEFLGIADEAGFNVVDATNINFRPTRESQGGTSLKFWEFELNHWAFHVERAYKNSGDPPDIATSGGHVVETEGKSVFPINLVLKHYPLRSPGQARKKVFLDRLPRFEWEKAHRGFHTQYDHFSEKHSWLWNPTDLNHYDASTVDKWLPEFSTRTGLRPWSEIGTVAGKTIHGSRDS